MSFTEKVLRTYHEDILKRLDLLIERLREESLKSQDIELTIAIQRQVEILRTVKLYEIQKFYDLLKFVESKK